MGRAMGSQVSVRVCGCLVVSARMHINRDVQSYIRRIVAVALLLSASGVQAAPSINANKEYPIEALRKGEQGFVVFDVTVGVDGRAKSCIVTRSSGS